MRVVWTAPSVGDLERIRTFIHADNPDAARSVVIRLVGLVESLPPMPHRGRAGRLFGTRELIHPDMPYIVVYRVARESVEVLRVLHASIRWPV